MTLCFTASMTLCIMQNSVWHSASLHEFLWKLGVWHKSVWHKKCDRRSYSLCFAANAMPLTPSVQFSNSFLINNSFQPQKQHRLEIWFYPDLLITSWALVSLIVIRYLTFQTPMNHLDLRRLYLRPQLSTAGGNHVILKNTTCLWMTPPLVKFRSDQIFISDSNK